MSFEENEPHSYVYVLTDEIQPAYKLELKGLFKKKTQLTEFNNSIDLINNGINKYYNRYVGTYDQFYFDKPEPIRLLSKTSYDELVRIFAWRHELDRDRTTTKDFDYAIIDGVPLNKYPLMKRKAFHVSSELRTMYSRTKNPNDPMFDKNDTTEFQLGPPSEGIGPDGKPFGDLHVRLVYDNILFTISMYYWYDVECKENLFNLLKLYEKFTNLQAFGMDELNKIIKIME